MRTLARSLELDPANLGFKTLRCQIMGNSAAFQCHKTVYTMQLTV